MNTHNSNPPPTNHQPAIPNPPGGLQGRVVIVKHDPMASDFIRQAVRAVGPTAEILCCRTARSGLAALRARAAQLGIFGLSFPDLDGLDLIDVVMHERLAWRLLVVSDRSDERTRICLREMRIDRFSVEGAESIGRFSDAIRCVTEGGRCSVTGPVASAPGLARPELQKLLTPLEQLTFAIIGDGCGNEAAAALLKRSVHAVCWHRSRIARKLGISTSAELVREAIRCGVVRIGPGGVQRPGFERVLADRRAGERSPADNAA